MAVVIATNSDSTKIQNVLNSATSRVSQSMERMSTGLKVNSAKDDAAGCVISEKMKVQLNGIEIAEQNVQNGNAMLSTAEGNVDTVLDNIERIRDLTLQAKNGTYSDEEIQAMDDEVQQRIQEINRVSGSAKYSSMQLFGDKTGLAKDGVTFQVGPNSGDTISVDKSNFASINFSAITGESKAYTLIGKTDAELAAYIEKVDDAVDNLTSRKSTLGSVMNRLDSAYSTLETQYENLESAKSVITDADIAKEASEYTQAEILQQISVSMLSQANQNPTIAASLV